MVEPAAVNRVVVGSSPTRGARSLHPVRSSGGVFVFYPRLPDSPTGYTDLCEHYGVDFGLGKRQSTKGDSMIENRTPVDIPVI